jgi:hypothetical protein
MNNAPLVVLGSDLCGEQLYNGRLFLGENPVKSAIWKEPRVKCLREHPDAIEVDCGAGAYSTENLDCEPIQKAHRLVSSCFITNSPELVQRLSLKMTPEQKMHTRPIQGKHTKASGEYCHGLARAILERLRTEAGLRNPQRFLTTKHEAYYTTPANLEEDWNPVLDEAEQRFNTRHRMYSQRTTFSTSRSRNWFHGL